LSLTVVHRITQSKLSEFAWLRIFPSVPVLFSGCIWLKMFPSLTVLFLLSLSSMNNALYRRMIVRGCVRENIPICRSVCSKWGDLCSWHSWSVVLITAQAGGGSNLSLVISNNNQIIENKSETCINLWPNTFLKTNIHPLCNRTMKS
jgi:hypothetical protein